MSARRTLRGRGDAGFTLIELMVSIGLSSVVAVGLYTLSMVASQTFQQQQRISEIQLRLRTAMEMLRSDAQRAGYMATPGSVVDPSVCPKPLSPVQGVMLRRAATNPTFNTSDNSTLNPVELVLTGNYVNTDEYLVMAINGNAVFLQHQTRAYNRIQSQPDMDRIFLNRPVRLMGANGQMQFNTVVGTSWTPATGTALPTLQLAQAPVIVGSAAGVGCGITGIGTSATIAPMTTVIYRIANVAATQSAAYIGAAPFLLGKTDLVREEVTLQAGVATPVAGTERIIAEYAVDLDVAAIYDSAVAGTGVQPFVSRYAFGAAQNFTLLGISGLGGAEPHRLRGMAIRLSVRDRAQDRDFGWTAPIAGAPLTRFRLDPSQSGAARVRSLTTEVSLPNYASRNLR